MLILQRTKHLRVADLSRLATPLNCTVVQMILLAQIKSNILLLTSAVIFLVFLLYY